MAIQIVFPCCVKLVFQTLNKENLKWLSCILKCHALNKHTLCGCVCVFSDHVASEAWDTDSSLGVGLEKNSLNSWCSS